ncbi:RebB family R body protein [Fluviicola sp.]|uniref:RebB family R body protein n=1 Tax=Fluviicola sp. TaxID=1917219 RepID=UPI003D2A92EE
MADIVNPQITDAVTQTNVKVLAEAPAMAMGTLYQTMAHSLGMLMENAVTAQQNMNVIGQASVTQGVTMIYSVDTASAGATTKDILDSNSKS